MKPSHPEPCDLAEMYGSAYLEWEANPDAALWDSVCLTSPEDEDD